MSSLFNLKEYGKFIPLIQKVPATRKSENYISFGFQKNASSYIFLLDIHNVGAVEAHSFYYDMLLNNVLNFLENLS